MERTWHLCPLLTKVELSVRKFGDANHFYDIL